MIMPIFSLFLLSPPTRHLYPILGPCLTNKAPLPEAGRDHSSPRQSTLFERFPGVLVQVPAGFRPGTHEVCASAKQVSLSPAPFWVSPRAPVRNLAIGNLP